MHYFGHYGSTPIDHRAATWRALGLLMALIVAGAPIAAKQRSVAEVTATDRATIARQYDTLPLSFIENLGQIDRRVAFHLRASNYDLYFTKQGHTLRLSGGDAARAKAHVIKVQLLGAATERIAGRKTASGVVSYWKGSKAQWRSGIPTHGEIGYVQPWSGIDLDYYGRSGKLESVYTVAPHADPALIKLRYSGQASLRIDDAGNLVYATSVGEVKETAPILYQEISGGRVSVAGRYRLLDKNTVTFDVGKYDPEHALVIDPTLVYSGFIGGSGSDVGYAIAIDSAGNAYVTGSTTSTAADFPLAAGPDLSANGLEDVFVAKVNAAGTALIYAGFIGGDASDTGYGIAVDDAGNAYVTGGTESTAASFPVLIGPDLTANGNVDVFVAKINAAGTELVYSGYIGGGDTDQGNGIAVDGSGNAYVAGLTRGMLTMGGPDTSYNGGSFDAFVAKINAAGSALVYAGYIGGNDVDVVNGIAVNASGEVWLTGATGSSEASFPVLIGPDLSHNGGGFLNYDAFVAKVNAAGNTLLYAGYIGGDSDDGGTGIVLDDGGNAYVSGYTMGSTEATFPVTVGPDLTYNGGFDDAFVAKVNASGSALVYAGYIGGATYDAGTGVAIDDAGNAYVSGVTGSDESSFPVLGGPDLTHNGGKIGFDGFVAKVNPQGTALIYAGYIGGDGDDVVAEVAVDNSGNAYVTGNMQSSTETFPHIGGPDLSANGGTDAFVAKVHSEEALIFGDSFE